MSDVFQQFDPTNPLYAKAFSNKALLRLSKTLGTNFNIGASAGIQTVSADGYDTTTKPTVGLDVQYVADNGTMVSAGVKNQILPNGDNNAQATVSLTIPFGRESHTHANGNRFTKNVEMQKLGDEGSHFDSSIVREKKKETNNTAPIAPPTLTNGATYNAGTNTISADGS